MSSNAIGNNASNLNAHRALEAATQGDVSLPTGGPRSMGEVKQSNSVIDAGNAKLQEQLKALTDTVMSLIKCFSQILAGAPNPNDGYGQEAAKLPTGQTAATRGTSGATPSAQASSSVSDDFARQNSEYNKQRNEVDAKNKAIDEKNKSLDPQIADKENELKHSEVIMKNWAAMRYNGAFSGNNLDEGQLRAIVSLPQLYTTEQREAAQYFIDNPDKYKDFAKTYMRSNGQGVDFLTESDFQGQRDRLNGEISALKGQRQGRLEYPPAPVLENPPPGTSTGSSPGSNKTPGGGNAPPADDKTPGSGAGGTNGPTPSVDTIAGDPLERAAERIGKKRQSIEDQIDSLTQRLGELDPSSPEGRKEVTELDRKIKSLVSIEGMLNNLESMLRQTIDNIIKMRHDISMNVVNNIRA
jgi:hypothetical protein